MTWSLVLMLSSGKYIISVIIPAIPPEVPQTSRDTVIMMDSKTYNVTKDLEWSTFYGASVFRHNDLFFEIRLLL